MSRVSVMLEILNRLLMRFCCASRGKRSEIAALTGLGVLLARVQTILARLQFPNHRRILPDLKLNWLSFWSGLPSQQIRGAPMHCASSRMTWLVATRNCAMLRSALSFSRLEWWRGNVSRTACAGNCSVLCGNHARRARWFAPMLSPSATLAASHPRAVLWRGQSPPPVYWKIFLRARPHELARWFLFPAYPPPSTG